MPAGRLRPQPLNEPLFKIQLANSQTSLNFDEPTLVAAAEEVLRRHGHGSATVSLAVVDDDEIHQLNRKYLDHDYATDVLSFRFSEPSEPLDGEVVVSADTAQRSAVEHGWSPVSELTLYVVHGMLHLVGYDDHQEDERQKMHQQQWAILTDLGHSPVEEDDS